MLIDALLQLSRVTRAEITREPVDLTAMAETVAANVKEENPERAMEITVDPGMEVNATPNCCGWRSKTCWATRRSLRARCARR